MSTMADSPHIAEATVRVDCGAPRGPLRRIWTSFGYDEINWTYTPPGKRAPADDRRASPSSRTTSARTTSSTAASAGRCRTGAPATSTTRTPTAAPFYDFTIADQVYDAIVAAGHQPLVELAFTPRALVPDDAEARLRATAEPHPVEPLRGRAVVVSRRRTTPSGAAWCARSSSTASSATAPSHVRGWLWELWNEPDISYWRGTAEQFYALYDVTAAAVKAALPDAAVGGPATTGDLGPGRRGPEFLRGFLAHCARRGTPLDFVSFHTKGARFTPWRVYGPIGGPAPEQQSPSSLKMLREVRAALRRGGRAPAVPRPALHRGRVRRLRPRPLGRLRQRQLRLPQHRVLPGLPVQADEEAARPQRAQRRARRTRPPPGASTSRASASSRAPAASSPRSGIEKPVLNAYRMLGRLGDTRLAAESSHAWSLDRLDDGEAGMPEEVDALATFNGGDRVQRAGLAPRRRPVRRPTPRETDVTLRVERLPFAGRRPRASALAHRRAPQQQPHGLAGARRAPGPSEAAARGRSRSARGSSASSPTGRAGPGRRADPPRRACRCPSVSLLEIRPTT